MSNHSPCSDRTHIISWLFLGLLILLEYCLFKTYVVREIVGKYPTGFDQITSLAAGYNLYEDILNNGVKPAIMNTMHNSPQTFLFPIQTAIFFLFFGASRLSALSLNFIYFACLQLMGYQTVRKITGKHTPAVIFLGLLLSTQTALSWGGLTDFRLDFVAFCLFGIFVCCVLRSDIFLNRTWLIISAIVAAILIMMRFITSVYIANIIIILFVYNLIKFFLQKDSQKLQTKSRIKNMILFGIIELVLCAPILWLNKQAIKAYYVVGHITGSEKYLRAKEVGITNQLSDILYYPKAFITIHLGSTATNLIIELLLITLVLYAISRLVTTKNASTKQVAPICFPRLRDDLIFLAISVLVPISILTLDLAKSSIVPGIILIPFLLIVTWIFIFLYKRIINIVPKLAYLFAVIASLIFISGAHNYLYLLAQHRVLSYYGYSTSLPKATEMYDAMGDYAYKKGWSTVNISADQMADYLIYPFTVLYYEQHHVLINLVPEFGRSGVIKETKTEAFNELKKSNFFITNANTYTASSVYPFENSIKPFRHLLQDYARKNFIKLGDYYFNKSHYIVYVNPSMK